MFNSPPVENINFLIAFTAGLLSFFTPCVLPLVPVFISYITGVTLKEASTPSGRRAALFHTLFFVFGFSLIFILLGATATFLGALAAANQALIKRVGGAVIILLGLYIIGILKVPFLDLGRRPELKSKPAGFLGSIIVGMTFSAGWTPCVGPILASILILASASGNPLSGVVLLFFFSLGLAVPFLITSLVLDRFAGFLSRYRRAVGAVSIASGTFLIVVGALLALDRLNF